jgi:hypothetical protein
MSTHEVTPDTIRLIEEEVQAQVDIDLREFGPLTARTYIHQAYDRLTIHLKGSVFIRDEYEPIVVFQTPKTWWDHFKLRWFPPFLLKRSPAELRDIKVSAKEVYPKLPMAVPKAQRHVIIETLDFPLP